MAEAAVTLVVIFIFNQSLSLSLFLSFARLKTCVVWKRGARVFDSVRDAFVARPDLSPLFAGRAPRPPPPDRSQSCLADPQDMSLIAHSENAFIRLGFSSLD